MTEDSARRCREAVARAREAMEELKHAERDAATTADEDEYAQWVPDPPEPEEDVDVMER